MILFIWNMAGLAEIIITPEIVMKTIGKLSVSVFYTETWRKEAAKIKTIDIQEKVKTEHGKEISHFLYSVLVRFITNIASTVKFSVQRESMWRKFHTLRCSILKDVWKSLL